MKFPIDYIYSIHKKSKANIQFLKQKTFNHLRVVTGENMIWGYSKLLAEKKILEIVKIMGEVK